MRFFAARPVRDTAPHPIDVDVDLAARMKRLPERFEAIAEAIIAGAPVAGPCAVVGRDLARDGVDLVEALTGLQTTYAVLTQHNPCYEATQALCVSWSEETLGYLHQVSCENPMTGLASLAHLRARLAEIQRGAERGGATAATTHALVVVELPEPALGDGRNPREYVVRSLEIARIAHRIRTVFGGDETISQVSPQRLVVLTARTQTLPVHAITVREFAAGIVPGAHAWIEGLPASSAGIAALLSELARQYGSV